MSHQSSILLRLTYSSGTACQVRHHWTTGMRPGQSGTCKVASKLPDISIIQILWETHHAERHRWPRNTGWRVQYTLRGCQKGRLRCCIPGSVSRERGLSWSLCVFFFKPRSHISPLKRKCSRTIRTNLHKDILTCVRLHPSCFIILPPLL